ncbi:carboxylesterase/lipase family protein [Methylocapsa sp. S129]|uniref:carboxylesterase/lipase family protein n=1 Tax=Methylocapsa sp. S129 TaxID=1641869 RepID=UPI00131E178A|nr:carboxylesterase family protein [Methylocapsa sp. S129]
MNDVIVRAPYGALRGCATATGLAFLGLRYGEPPVGERRWAPPSRYKPPDGMVDATHFGPSPPQIASPATPWRAAFAPREMSEDCLNLNVWTPAADGARRPVLVHVFGGGFETGSASEGLQDAAALSAQAGAVVVRINFRIGALGFLSLGDSFGREFAAGNVALLDLRLALEWVRDNVGALGGDPDNVTIFGLSSGAFMIAALFALPETHGLFARAWMQSGSASRVLTRAQASATTETFLREVSVAAGDRDGLAKLGVEAILAAQRKVAALDLGDRNAPGGRTLGIVEDGVTLTRHPMSAFTAGERRDAPIVLGCTRDEARLWFAARMMRLPQAMDDVLAEMIRFSDAESGARLFAFYRARYGDLEPVGLREKFLSDAVYGVPALRTALAHGDAGGAAFLYRFDWSAPGAAAALGASHGFDEAFVWNAADARRFPLAAGDDDAAKLGEAMSSALIAFATNGSPGWPSLSESGAIRLFGGGSSAFAEIDRPLLDAWEGVARR